MPQPRQYVEGSSFYINELVYVKANEYCNAGYYRIVDYNRIDPTELALETLPARAMAGCHIALATHLTYKDVLVKMKYGGYDGG